MRASQSHLATAPLKTSRSTRSGYFAAKSTAMNPPIEPPCTWHLSMPSCVEQTGHVVDPDIHPVLLVRSVALPVAAVIEVDHGEVVRHVRRDQRIPLMPVDRAADLNDRRSYRR